MRKMPEDWRQTIFHISKRMYRPPSLVNSWKNSKHDCYSTNSRFWRTLLTALQVKVHLILAAHQAQINDQIKVHCNLETFLCPAIKSPSSAPWCVKNKPVMCAAPQSEATFWVSSWLVMAMQGRGLCPQSSSNTVDTTLLMCGRLLNFSHRLPYLMLTMP